MSRYQPIEEPQGRYEALDSQPSQQVQPLSRLARFGRGLRDPIDGLAQGLTNFLPAEVVTAGNDLNNWIADRTGLLGTLPRGGVDQMTRDQNTEYEKRRSAQLPDPGIDWMRMGGNVFSPATLALTAVAPAATTMTLAGRVGIGAATGAAQGAMAPVTSDGDYTRTKLKQIGSGAFTGGIVPMGTAALARIVSPLASRNQNIRLLRSEGVTPTVGQSLGGRWNAAEEKATSIPIVGDAIATARGKSREQFNNAAINRATAPIGMKINGTGTQAVAEAGDAIGAVYDKARASLGGFKIDPQAQVELTSLRNMASNGLQGREKNAVAKYFSDYLNRPTLTAQSFKELDSKLNSDIARFGAGDAYQQKVADALKEVQRVVTDNAKRANPVAADLFKKADKAYANLVRVEGASVGAKGTDGVFTPGQLLTAVRGADRSVRDRATARGGALMQDLASAGQMVLGNKIPNSATADRLMLGAGALGTGFIHPAIPLGLVGGAAMYTSPMQRLLSSAVSTRPQLAEPVADAFRKTSPALGLLGSQVGIGLLN